MTEETESEISGGESATVGGFRVESVLFTDDVNEDLLHRVVRWQRAAKRAGTHSVLTRGAMKGGGAKPWRQKGTGRARAGSNTSPLWVGGGVAHGPKPRDYSFSLNKKERKKALRCALTARRNEGRLLLVDDFEFAEIKTKAAEKVLRGLGISKREKVVVVLRAGEDTAAKSFRNLKGVKVIRVEGLNVYDVLNGSYAVLSKAAFGDLEARLGV